MLVVPRLHYAVPRRVYITRICFPTSQAAWYDPRVGRGRSHRRSIIRRHPMRPLPLAAVVQDLLRGSSLARLGNGSPISSQDGSAGARPTSADRGRYQRMVPCVHSHGPQPRKPDSFRRWGPLGDRLGQQRVLPKVAGDGRNGCLWWAAVLEAVSMVHGRFVSEVGVTLASCHARCTSLLSGDAVAVGSGSLLSSSYM